MDQSHDYPGQSLRSLVVFPNSVAGAIVARRAKLGLPTVPVAELEYGLDEVMQLVNLLGAELLTGKQATLIGLLEKLRAGWDLIWFITHAEPEGWYLNDGLVNVSETTTLIRSSGIFLTVMNTCSSLEVAEVAADELGTAFICTVREVPDRQAFITGVIFAQKLAAGHDYVEAFNLARPGQDRTYRLITARQMASMGNPRVPAPYQGGQYGAGMPSPETVNRFIISVQELNLIVNGNPHIDYKGLKGLVKDLETDFEKIQAQLTEIKERQQVRNWVMWGLITAVVILLIIIALLAFWIGGLV